MEEYLFTGRMIPCGKNILFPPISDNNRLLSLKKPRIKSELALHMPSPTRLIYKNPISLIQVQVGQ